MTTSFNTFNQFDKRFSKLEKFSKDRSCCPFFGLITCYNYMTNLDTSQLQHERNIYLATMNYIKNNVPKYMSFDELLTNATLNISNICGTTPQLITSGILGYDNIFKFDNDMPYCILFLKNSNYLSILCNNSNYYLRDCHETTQYNFTNFSDLKRFLDHTYQFERDTIVDDVSIPEYSNIEYIVIDGHFDLPTIDFTLYDETLENKLNVDKMEVNESYINTKNYETDNMMDDYSFALSLQMEEDDLSNYVDFN